MKGYSVVACFARRYQKELVQDDLQAKYPTGYWWITGSGIHEFRVPFVTEEAA